MKKIVTLSMLFFFFYGVAQDPLLFNNSWYLKRVVVASNEYFSSATNGYPQISFVQDPNDEMHLYHPECNDLAWYEIQHIGTDSFVSLGFSGGLPGGCMTLPQMEYSQKHHAIYNVTNSPMTYTLTNDSGQWSLVITNVIGDKAYYGDAQLNNNSFKKNIFSIYPNPTHDLLKFNDLNKFDIVEIKLYEISGKIIPTNNNLNWSIHTLDVSNLSSGIYYLSAYFKDGAISNQKFIKK
jgi:hypothetical protein